MPMSCSICTGSLEKAPPDDPTALPGAGALPCGHVFHQHCIQKWISVSGPPGSVKLCPMCRKAVPGGKCLELYPDIQDPTILEDSISPSRCNHLIEIFSLQNKLAESNTKANEVMALEAELEEQREINDELTDEVEGLKQELAALNSLKAALEAVKATGTYQDTYNWPVDEFSIQQLKGHKQFLVNDLKEAERKASTLTEKLWTANKEKTALMDKLKAATKAQTNLIKDLNKARNETMDVTDKYTRTMVIAEYWQSECTKLDKQIISLQNDVSNLEKAAAKPVVVMNVKPLPKSKSATNAAVKTSNQRSTSTVPPPTRRGKNSTMPANLPQPPKPPTVPAKTNTNRKSYATRSKARIQTN